MRVLVMEGEGPVQGREIKVSVVVGEIRGELVITVELCDAAGRRCEAQVVGRLRDTEGGRCLAEIRVLKLGVEVRSEELLAPALLCHKEPARVSKAPY